MSDIKKIIEEDYQRKVKKFEQMSEQGKATLIGDSMVAYLNLSKFGLEKEMINQGIAGDTTLGVLNRVHLVSRLNPKIVIISVGSNDMVLTDLTFDETVKNILKVKKEIESDTNAKVYVMSLTPVLRDHEITNSMYVSNRTNQDISYINHQLKERINETEFINIYDDLIDNDGNLNYHYTTDGIHLNHKGYEHYTKHIKNIIK
ncbi:MAG: hypothetical protein KKH92_03060 [Firmicutes bacterium]|nr:hypothetical protein [Bacillota bacterium]